MKYFALAALFSVMVTSAAEDKRAMESSTPISHTYYSTVSPANSPHEVGSLSAAIDKQELALSIGQHVLTEALAVLNEVRGDIAKKEKFQIHLEIGDPCIGASICASLVKIRSSIKEEQSKPPLQVNDLDIACFKMDEQIATLALLMNDMNRFGREALRAKLKEAESPSTQ